MHALALQTTAHLVLHVPQLFASLVVSTQDAPQAVGLLDGHWQMPDAQVASVGQTVPHLPQFEASICVSTHAPAHA